MAMLEELRTNAARRTRALRKVRAAQHIDPEIKLAIQVILDLLSHKSGYCIAWPSAATIAKRLKNGRRTGQWYLRIIKALGIFKCTQLSPADARAYCKQKYRFQPNLDQCVTYAPILFEPNFNHPLWNSSKNLPAEVDEEMGKIIRQIKAKRNAKTTSRLASNPDKRPKHTRSRYCLETIRTRIRKTRDALRDDVANDAILADAEEERWCRERLLDDVANDIQVFRLSSVEANVLIAPPSEILNAVATPSVTRSPEGLPSGNPARRHCELTTHPPSTLLAWRSGGHDSPEYLALASECRSAPSFLSRAASPLPSKPTQAFLVVMK
jgi:hypothetical protein